MSIQQRTASARLHAGVGVASVVVSFLGIFLAAAVSSQFSLFGNALSDLGARGAATAPIFNGAVLVSGALGTAFALGLWDVTEDGIRRAALVLLAPGLVCLALVGAFPLPDPMHSLVAPLFFLLMTLGVAVWGAGDFASGHPTRGGTLVIGATLHVVSWLWWIILGWPGPGIAAPELVGSLTLGTWAVWVSVDRWPDAIEPSQL